MPAGARWPLPLARDLMPAADGYDLNDNERRMRQAFLDITAADAANVRALRATFTEHARAFAERFYEHLLSFPHTAELLQDSQQLERLKELQADYFAQLLDGAFDTRYYEGRLRVGLAHQQAGLDPAWYLGAYNQYIQLTFPVFARAFGSNLDKVLPLLLSLVKVIFLDIGLALHSYFRKSTQALRRHNEELQQALALYWESLRREEQLRRVISHEIRGGLAAVITSLEDLSEVVRPALSASAAEQLDSVTKRCWSLSGLLGEMLARAKDSGPMWVDTTQIFETLVARFGLYAEGRAIHLHLPEHPPRVWADPFQLREIFANLVGNAVRYLDKERGRIEITCRADGDFSLFCVADNGPGIPAAIRPKLFEPFVRGPDPTDRPTSGAGLGLYFVRSAIEHGGGRIWVESAPGQGCRFWFTVPRVPPSGQAERAAHERND